MSETVVSVFEDDVKHALRLKDDLLKGRRVASLAIDHPLRPGFIALGRHIEGGPLGPSDRAALNDILLFSRTLYSFEGDWGPRAEQLLGDLRSVKRSPSLLFELNVGAFLAKWARTVNWTAFEESVPDWSAREPDFEVECKLARSGAKVDDYGRYLREVADRHPARPGPLVAAIGFNAILDNATLAGMRGSARRHLAWMTRHREVSAVLLFGQKPATMRREVRFGWEGTRFREQVITVITNLNAFRPLPPDMPFVGGPDSEVFRFQGPSSTLADARQVKSVPVRLSPQSSPLVHPPSPFKQPELL